MLEIKGHAVVIGAGTAGLLAARVLSETYDWVTVFDRDAVAAEAGEPHGPHAHAVLPRCRDVLDELFPGFTATLAEHGVDTFDPLGDCRWHLDGRPVRRRASGLRALPVSRSFLRAELYELIRARPGIGIIDNCAVTDLVADGTRVRGVRVLPAGGSGEAVSADLVVDASGAGSVVPAWLAAHEYPAPPTERLGPSVAFASRRYRLVPDALDGDIAAICGPTSTESHCGVLIREEDGWWRLSLGDCAGSPPPDSDNGSWLRFAETLATLDIRAALSGGEPAGEPTVSRPRATVRHRYDLLSEFPDGLLVLGSAVARFDPLHAQSITVAALHALELRRCLADGVPAALFRPFFAAAHRIADLGWPSSAGSRLRWLGLRADRGLTADRIAGP
jgi:2-polyprenyl-6-methoxyphenol hydroxylase-like FAD-dependent oxidoreductase